MNVAPALYLATYVQLFGSINNSKIAPAVVEAVMWGVEVLLLSRNNKVYGYLYPSMEVEEAAVISQIKLYAPNCRIFYSYYYGSLPG